LYLYFDGVHSIPGDLVDLLTRNGTFAFLEDLHETGRLWDLRNLRIPRLVPRGTASKDFGAPSYPRPFQALPRTIPPQIYPPGLCPIPPHLSYALLATRQA
jgi:hypothetical protein